MIATCLTNPPIKRWSPLPTSISVGLFSLKISESVFSFLGMEHDEGRRGKNERGKSKEEEKLLR